MAEVLVVDDNHDNLLLARLFLQHGDHLVETVDTGRGALARLRERRFDVVLLDLRMPDMDGRTVLKELTADAALASTPVIVFSAHADPSIAAEMHDLGCSAFLTKPFTLEELLAAVESVL